MLAIDVLCVNKNVKKKQNKQGHRPPCPVPIRNYPMLAIDINRVK